MKAEAEYFSFLGESFPTCSHQDHWQVGTVRANDMSDVPGVPSVPTYDHGSTAFMPVPVLDNYEERAAILEHDAGLLRSEAETWAAWEQGWNDPATLHCEVVRRCALEIERMSCRLAADPEGRPHLQQARAFIYEGWAFQAVRLGWDEVELFGVSPRAPWARLDRKGVAFGGSVQAVTVDAVLYTNGLRRCRSNVNIDGGAVPVWELPRDVDGGLDVLLR